MDVLRTLIGGNTENTEESSNSSDPTKAEAPATQPPTNPPTQPVVTNPPATQLEPTQPPQTQPVVEEPTEYDPIAEARALCKSEEDFARFDYAVEYMRSRGITSQLHLTAQAYAYQKFCRKFGEENVVLGDIDDLYDPDGKNIMAWHLVGYDDAAGEEIWSTDCFAIGYDAETGEIIREDNAPPVATIHRH